MAKVNMASLKEDPPARVLKVCFGVAVDGTEFTATFPLADNEDVCPRCEGSGRDETYDYSCMKCGGNGTITTEEEEQ